MALRGTRVDNFHELLCLVLQEDWAFEFYQPVLTKNYMGWPQQPLTEKVPDISEKWDFLISIPQ